MAKDEGLRETTLEGLSQLKAVAGAGRRAHRRHLLADLRRRRRPCSSSPARRPTALGLTPRARVVDTCLVGGDPVLMLTGPIDATQHLLERNSVSMGDIDLVEINEAFASVVLAWERELSPDTATVNPNGGAIALGHPLGGTGAILITKALHELERTDGDHRPRHHVLRRRPRHRHPPRAHLSPRPEALPVGIRHGSASSDCRFPRLNSSSEGGAPCGEPLSWSCSVHSRARGRAVRPSIPAPRRWSMSSTATPWSSTSPASRRPCASIGVDTPETVDPDQPPECFGAEASAHTKALLPEGTEVRLTRDVEARDRYDRLLVYVERAEDDLFVNLDLVAGGWADDYPFPPNVAHERDFALAVAEARAQGLGLWATCGNADTPAGG